MLSLSLEQLAAGSTRVVIGRAISFQSFLPSPGQPIYTEVTFLVDKELKGAFGDKELRVRLPGGRIGDLLVNAGGTASFDVGRHTVVFLFESSPETFQVVGRKQGKFAIGDDGTVERVGLDLADFNGRILEAVRGTLLPAHDPLVGHGAIYLTAPALNLKPWKSEDIPLAFYVNGTTQRPPQIKPEDFATAVKHGFDAWQDLEESHIAFSYAGQTIRQGNSQAFDGYNDVRWGISIFTSNPFFTILGRTIWWARNDRIFEADIEIEPFPTGIFWTIGGGTDQDLNVTLIHEAGHFLGIADHTFGSRSVMTEFYGGQAALGELDRKIVKSMYPLGPGPRPIAPSGLKARQDNATTTFLTWKDNSPDEYGYDIERSRNSAGPFARVATVKRNVTSFRESGLERNGAYYYRVRSFNQNGESEYSGYAGNTFTFEDSPDRTIGEGTELGGQLASFRAFSNVQSLSATIDWGDGTSEKGYILDTGGGGSVTGSHVFPDNGTFEVVVTVKDTMGGFAQGGFTVNVENAAPHVEAGPDIDAVEGRAVSLPKISFSDFGPRDTHTASIDWGDGSVEPATLTEKDGSGQVTGSHIYADNGNFVVNITVTDNDGASNTESLTLAVSNLPPSLELYRRYETTIEGSLFHLVAYFFDPGLQDTHTVSIDWGDGLEEPGTLTEKDGAERVTGSHVYPDNGNFAINITVTDNDGASNTESLTLAVSNLPPSLELYRRFETTIEGSPFYLVAYFVDPGLQDTHTVSIDWGDGLEEPGTLTEKDGAGRVTGSHIYPNDGVFDAMVTLMDKDGARISATLDAAIANASPVVEGRGAPVELNGEDQGLWGILVRQRREIILSAVPFTDSGPNDIHVATFDWGDGSSGPGTVTPGAISSNEGTGSVSGSHRYPGDGTYTVTVTVNDEAGATGSDTVSFTIKVLPQLITLIAVGAAALVLLAGGLVFWTRCRARSLP